jgi:hypothetical protein
MVPRLCWPGNARCRPLFDLCTRSSDVSRDPEANCRAGRHQGHEGSTGKRHHRPLHHPSWRHQRAGLGARGARLLEKGVADAITFPWGSIVLVLFGIDKVAKYHMDAGLYATEQTGVLNKARYESLSSQQKKVMDDHCTTPWALQVASPWADFEANGRDKIKAQEGHQVTALLRPPSSPNGARPPCHCTKSGRGQSARTGTTPKRSLKISRRPWPNTGPHTECAAKGVPKGYRPPPPGVNDCRPSIPHLRHRRCCQLTPSAGSAERA